MDISRVTPADLTENYVNAGYYSRRFLDNELTLANCGFPRFEIGGASSRCNCGATPKKVIDEGIGQALIRTSDVRQNKFNSEKLLRTNRIRVKKDSPTAAISGDLLFTMSGTVGIAAVIYPCDEVFSFSNTIARVRFAKGDSFDTHFVSAFLNSRFGYLQSIRLTSGGIQGHVMPNPFKRLLIPKPAFYAQAYVGRKLRQSEGLRTFANVREQQFRDLIFSA